MLQAKLLSVLGALSIGIIALVGGAGPSKADIIIPGNDTTILSQCGGRADTQPGVVCGNTLNLGAGVTATGGSGGNLTFKPTGAPFNNVFGQSGIGEGGTPPPAGTGCTNPTCEIGDANSVTVSSTSANIEDVVIGSVQAGESFLLAGVLHTGGTSTCNTSAGADTCSVSFSPVSTITVQNQTGDVLVSEVSLVQPAPEPASLMLLGTGLLGLGLLRYRRKRVN